jgi:hypothetical protein
MPHIRRDSVRPSLLKSKRGVGLLMSWILPRPPSALLLGRRRRRRRHRFKFSLGPLFSLDPFSFQLNLSPLFSSSSFPVKEKQKEEAKTKSKRPGVSLFLSFCVCGKFSFQRHALINCNLLCLRTTIESATKGPIRLEIVFPFYVEISPILILFICSTNDDVETMTNLITGQV